MNVLCCLLCISLTNIMAMWPPAFQVDLHQEENFVLSPETLFSEDDEEMIKENELTPFQLPHKRSNVYVEDNNYKDYKDSNQVFSKSLGKQTNTDLMYGKNYDISYYNPDGEQYSSIRPQIFKRSITEGAENEGSAHETIYDYSYAQFKKEYEEEIQNDVKNGSAFIYNEEGQEETAEEAVEAIVKFESPTNCSQEQLKNIGIQGITCLLHEYKQSTTSQNKIKVLKNLLRLIIIWFLIYCAIALPCWCQKGWCCWCFMYCFSICRPEQTIQNAKKYIAKNPPGMLVLNDETIIQYEPSLYELEAYENFNNFIRIV